MSTGSVPVATAAQRGGQGVERERPLSELERDKYEDLLRKLTVRAGLDFGSGRSMGAMFAN